MKNLVPVMLVLLAFAGCATPVTQRVKVDSVAAELEAKKQREIALASLFEDRMRLDRVAFPLLVKGVPLCGEKTRYRVGAFLINANALKEFAEAGRSLWGLTDIVQVVEVVPGSPAQAAGIKPGDLPVALNDWQVPVGEEAVKRLDEKLEELTKTGAPFTVRLIRGGQTQAVEVFPVKACGFKVLLSEKDDVNAYADGNNAIITRGMLRFAKDDTELALVVAHEIAHNAMGHTDKKMQNYLLGSIFDLLAAAAGVNTQGAFGKVGAAAYSQDFEAEADYVGLYMMALAGMDITNAPRFWRRMAAAHPGSIRASLAATHPATPERLLALEKTVEEINLKKAKGLALTPELKKQPSGNSR